jgi:hypothetical protein
LLVLSFVLGAYSGEVYAAVRSHPARTVVISGVSSAAPRVVPRPTPGQELRGGATAANGQPFVSSLPPLIHGWCNAVPSESTSACAWARGPGEWDQKPSLNGDVRQPPLRVGGDAGGDFWQTRWLNRSVVTSEGLTLSCRTVWHIPNVLEMLGRPIHPQRPSLGLCDIEITELTDAWRAAPRDPVSGYKVGAPTLLKSVQESRYTTHFVNRRPVLSTAAREISVLRVHKAVVTLHGYVFNDNIIVRGRFSSIHSNVTQMMGLLAVTSESVVRAKRVVVLQSAWSSFPQHFGLDVLPVIVATTDLVKGDRDIAIVHDSGPVLQTYLPVRLRSFPSPSLSPAA